MEKDKVHYVLENTGRDYHPIDDIDFSIITSRIKHLPFFDDDLFLGMQAMNLGCVDPLITQYEYSLLQELFDTERTPTELAMVVSSLSQMWIYSCYEVMRMWRDRMYHFKKLFDNGGIEPKLSNMNDEFLNINLSTRKYQMQRYKESEDYRQKIDEAWDHIEPVFRLTELVRINLAKHCAPGKNNLLPRAPGYGRINGLCGALDWEVLHQEGHYTTINRRDIADALRQSLIDAVEWSTS